MVPSYTLTHTERGNKMATDKLFTVVGTSTVDGKTKVRFANDTMRIKILAKNGHANINLIELPTALNKVDAVRYMQSQNYGDGDLDVQAAMAHVLKKYKASEPVVNTEVTTDTEVTA
jgi:hypothetical protein